MSKYELNSNISVYYDYFNQQVAAENHSLAYFHFKTVYFLSNGHIFQVNAFKRAYTHTHFVVDIDI